MKKYMSVALLFTMFFIANISCAQSERFLSPDPATDTEVEIPSGWIVSDGFGRRVASISDGKGRSAILERRSDIAELPSEDQMRKEIAHSSGAALLIALERKDGEEASAAATFEFSKAGDRYRSAHLYKKIPSGMVKLICTSSPEQFLDAYLMCRQMLSSVRDVAANRLNSVSQKTSSEHRFESPSMEKIASLRHQLSRRPDSADIAIRLAAMRERYVRSEAVFLHEQGLAVKEKDPQAAERFFTQAIEIDPTYAPPYASVGALRLAAKKGVWETVRQMRVLLSEAPPSEEIRALSNRMEAALRADEGQR